jgi:hypothetical protein
VNYTSQDAILRGGRAREAACPTAIGTTDIIPKAQVDVCCIKTHNGTKGTDPLSRGDVAENREYETGKVAKPVLMHRTMRTERHAGGVK